MQLGRVVGNLTSTVAHPYYAGLTILLVEPIDVKGKRRGRDLVAVDRVGAGPGEWVLLMEEGGGAAETIQKGDRKPVDTVVLAIVDEVKMGE